MTSLYQPIEEMIRTVNESADQDFATSVGKYLDLTEVMKYLGTETFTVEWDGLAGNWTVNNFYLYRFRTGAPSQLIPWDKDHAFTFIEIPIMFRLDTNVLASRSLADPALRQVFFDTLLQLADIADQQDPNDPRGWLEREFERQAALVAPAVAEDPVFPFTAEEHQADVDYLMRFARSRSAYVRCDIARTQDPSIETPCETATATPTATSSAPLPKPGAATSTAAPKAGAVRRQVSANTTQRENSSY